MTPNRLTLCSVTLLALGLAGCEFDNGIAVRAKEKPEAYASLQLWQKRFVDKGVIARGFTTDMVYIAMGRPSKVEAKDLKEGHVEVWSYKNYYPNDMQATMGGYRAAEFSRESPYQPQMKMHESGAAGYGTGSRPVGMSSTPESISLTGPPQGASMEPADLQSYTYVVWFLNGKVVQYSAGSNP